MPFTLIERQNTLLRTSLKQQATACLATPFSTFDGSSQHPSEITYESRIFDGNGTHGDGIVPFIKNGAGVYVANPSADEQNDYRNPLGVRCELWITKSQQKNRRGYLTKKFQIAGIRNLHRQ